MTKENKNLTRGFTLLELLVVVLIIGILAAIALPQYKMAVTKAEVAALLPLLRRGYDAVQEHYLIHNNYDLVGSKNMDIEMGSDWSCNDEDKSLCIKGHWNCYWNANRDGALFCVYVHFGDDDMMIMMNAGSDIQGVDGLTCQAYTEDEVTKKTCNKLGFTTLVEDSNSNYLPLVYR